MISTGSLSANWRGTDRRQGGWGVLGCQPDVVEDVIQVKEVIAEHLHDLRKCQPPCKHQRGLLASCCRYWRSSTQGLQGLKCSHIKHGL